MCSSSLRVAPWCLALVLGCQTTTGGPPPPPTTNPSPERDGGQTVIRVDGGSGSSSTGGTASSSASASSGGAQGCDGVQPGPAPVRLLTRSEYNHAVRDLLGDVTDPARVFPPENLALGFENNAEAHKVSPLFIQKAMEAAEDVAARAIEPGRLNALLPCAASSTTAATQRTCAESFVDGFSRRAFRRPLTTDERASLLQTFDETLPLDGFQVAIGQIIVATLQSPAFLYRIHQVRPDETPGTPVVLGGYEMASRLSFFLWNTIPDEALLAAAADGSLSTRDGVTTQVRRMLADERINDGIRDFHRQYLHLDKLDHAERDLPSPGMDLEAIGRAWKESLLQFLVEVSRGDGNTLQKLLTGNTVYVNEHIAGLYGVTASGSAMTRTTLSSTERAGLLTQPGLMALLAHPNQSSPVHRGIFVREKLLCETLQPPPPNVIITPPELDPNATTRQRFAQHTQEASCQSCHVLIDPIGFGFEKYDALGRFRSMENNISIDATGDVVGSLDVSVEGAFDGALELSTRLAGSPYVSTCLARQWYRYANGRGDSAPGDACNLRRATDDFHAQGTNLEELLVSLSTQDGFRLRDGVVRGEVPPIVDDEPDAGMPALDAGMAEPDAGVIVGDPTPRQPMGYLDHISRAGLVSGWALDPNRPGYPLSVETWLDGPPGQGTYLFPVNRADQPRADVNQVTGWPGDHGFTFVLNQSLNDGRMHTLYLVANDAGDDGPKLLEGSGMMFQIGAGNALPRCYVDTISPAGDVAGWGFDPSDPPTNVLLTFYLDAHAFNGGVFLGQTTAGGQRPDVNQVFGVNATSGWGFALPPAARDGAQHLLYVYAMDLTEPSELFTFCNDTPLTFQVQP